MKDKLQNKKGLSIEKKSMKIISGLLNGREFSPNELPVVYRVIHATGDPEFENIMEFHIDALKAGIEAIKKGKDILVDVRMVEAGINKRLLNHFGGKILCLIDNDKVIQKAKKEFKTRAETSIEMAAIEDNRIGIVAIGNAPTALLKVVQYIKERKFLPDLVIGVPVGFVMAKESKEVLMELDYPFISCRGTKGGSPVAVSIINAMLMMANE